jgi:ABC-type sugar transport system ATPase subunit
MPLTAAPDPAARARPGRAAPLTPDGIIVTVPEPGGGAMHILDIPALHIPAGQSIGVAGPSGAGKTTLLHLIAGLLLPSTGIVAWGDRTVNVRSEGARDRWRRREVGLVFQDFALVPELSVLDNIVLPASFQNWRVLPALRSEAAALAERLGLAKLSRQGGIAVARRAAACCGSTGAVRQASAPSRGRTHGKSRHRKRRNSCRHAPRRGEGQRCNPHRRFA